MPERYGPPWLWSGYFSSKQEVIDHWWALIRLGEDFAGPMSLTSPSSLDLVYSPGTGFKYVVGLATPEDNETLAGLGDEFVRDHSELFAKDKMHQGVEHQTWARYLGFHASPSGTFQMVGKKTTVQTASRFNFHALCNGGCVLKCRAELEAPQRRIVRRQSSTGSNSSAAGKPPHPGVVGYISFTMEEGTSSSAPRSSKRLKRKRGESTGEYTKVNHLLVTRAHRDKGLALLLLTAVLHRVKCLDPSYAREIFLTVIKRNDRAVALYQGMGLKIIGQNTTHLAKVRADKSRPIVWYQMCLNLESDEDEASQQRKHQIVASDKAG